MKDLCISTILYIFCVVLIVLYTFFIYFIGHSFWPEKASGSLILDEKQNIRGSYLMAQHLEAAKYFKARPTKAFYNECDVALYNPKFKEALISNYDKAGRPYDVTMLTPSASLYDPFITKREAMSQAIIVSNARKIDKEEVYKLIDDNVLSSQPPFFVLDIVNVTILNAKLDGYTR